MSRGLVLTFGQRQSNLTCKIRLFFLGMHSFPCYEMLRGHDKVTDNWGWIQNVLVIATIWVVIVKAPHTFSNIKLFIQVQEFHRGSRFSSFASRLYKDWQQSKIQQNIKIKFSNQCVFFHKWIQWLSMTHVLFILSSYSESFTTRAAASPAHPESHNIYNKGYWQAFWIWSYRDCEFYSSVFSSGNGGKVYIPLWHDVASILNNLSSMARRYALSTVTQLL